VFDPKTAWFGGYISTRDVLALAWRPRTTASGQKVDGPYEAFFFCPQYPLPVQPRSAAGHLRGTAQESRPSYYENDPCASVYDIRKAKRLMAGNPTMSGPTSSRLNSERQHDPPTNPAGHDHAGSPLGRKVSPGGRRVAIGVRTTTGRRTLRRHLPGPRPGERHDLPLTGPVAPCKWNGWTIRPWPCSSRGRRRSEGQVWLYEGLAGDGWAVTDHKSGVEWFKPFAGGLLYRGAPP